MLAEAGGCSRFFFLLLCFLDNRFVERYLFTPPNHGHTFRANLSVFRACSHFHKSASAETVLCFLTGSERGTEIKTSLLKRSVTSRCLCSLFCSFLCHAIICHHRKSRKVRFTFSLCSDKKNKTKKFKAYTSCRLPPAHQNQTNGWLTFCRIGLFCATHFKLQIAPCFKLFTMEYICLKKCKKNRLLSYAETFLCAYLATDVHTVSEKTPPFKQQPHTKGGSKWKHDRAGTDWKTDIIFFFLLLLVFVVVAACRTTRRLIARDFNLASATVRSARAQPDHTMPLTDEVITRRSDTWVNICPAGVRLITARVLEQS